MLVKSEILFNKCYGQFAIAAINVWSMEQIFSLFQAADRSKSPFIIQTTPVARNYANETMLISMISAAARIFPDVVYTLHLDHGNYEHAFQCINSKAYTSVMIDGSHLSFEENISLTSQIVEYAHKNNINVEAELGVLSGIEDDLQIEHSQFTQPNDVEEFVKRTQCDSLAVAVGTSHGAYKFSGKQGLQMNLLKRIQQKMPGFPLVLHGASSVDKNEISRINSAGGKLGSQASGVADAQIVEAIAYGVCKVNIATDARLIWTRVHREFFKASPELFDPIIPGKTYSSELEDFYQKKFKLLNSVGKATIF